MYDNDTTDDTNDTTSNSNNNVTLHICKQQRQRAGPQGPRPGPDGRAGARRRGLRADAQEGDAVPLAIIIIIIITIIITSSSSCCCLFIIITITVMVMVITIDITIISMFIRSSIHVSIQGDAEPLAEQAGPLQAYYRIV